MPSTAVPFFAPAAAGNHRTNLGHKSAVNDCIDSTTRKEKKNKSLVGGTETEREEMEKMERPMYDEEGFFFDEDKL